MVKHLLVTNDYPPKVGGIQSYLWELWRRLPPEEAAVLTTAYEGSAAFDRGENYRIERTDKGVLIPTPALFKRINRMAADHDADIVLLDPAIPVGMMGPKLDRPFGLILHGAEVTVPGRLPGSKSYLSSLLRRASMVMAAGTYPLKEAQRAAGVRLPSIVIPPGVDSSRFSPIAGDRRSEIRKKFGVADNDFLLASVNRLVPRKGMATVIEAVAKVASDHPEHSVRFLLGGDGRQRRYLGRLAKRTSSPTTFLGRITDMEVAELYGVSDLMAMMCNERWLGLEQEGFGIAFLEAAASGIPQIAGRSGGSHEAVVHDVTGLILDDSRDVSAVAEAILTMIDDDDRRQEMGRQARIRVSQEFDYDQLAKEVQSTLEKIDFS